MPNPKKDNNTSVKLVEQLYAPAFLSALLTVAFSEELYDRVVCWILIKQPWYSFVAEWYGLGLIVLVAFIVFSLATLGIGILCKYFYMKDNKRTKENRNQLVEYFHQTIADEMQLALRWYELAVARSNTCDAHMRYYANEALYHFSVISNMIKENQIIEYELSDRSNLNKFYELVGTDSVDSLCVLSRECLNKLKAYYKCDEKMQTRIEEVRVAFINYIDRIGRQ